MDKIQVFREELKTLEGREKVDCMLDFSWDIKFTQPQKSIALLHETRKLARQISYQQGIVISLHYLSVCHDIISQYDKALSYAFDALNAAEEISDMKSIGNALNMIGAIYWRLGDYSEALEYLFKSLDKIEPLSDNKRKANVMNNIGLIYWESDDYDNALKYMFKSLRLCREVSECGCIARLYNNIGLVHWKKKNYSEALEYYEKSLTLYRKLENRRYEAVLMENIGVVYRELNAYPRALEYLSEGLEIFREIEEDYAKTGILMEIGDVYLDQNEVESALSYFYNALEIAENINVKPFQYQIHLGLAKAHKQKNEFEKALQHHEKFYKIREEVFNENTTHKLNNLHVIHQVEKAQKEAEIVRSKNEELAELIATKDKFFSIIAHDLKNPINLFLGYSDFLSRNYDHIKNQERLEIIQKMDESAKQLHKLLMNLLNWARAQTGRLNFNPEILSMADMLEESIVTLKSCAVSKGIDLTINPSPGIYGVADAEMIETVIRNLVSNAIKFTERGGTVEIFAEDRGDVIEISVVDTGVGISEERIEHLFDIGEKYISTPGTEQEKGTGLGLILCKEFVEKNGGKIWAENNVGKGSTFRFTLPAREN